MARSEKSRGKELHLLKSILNSSSQCSLSEDPKPKETIGDDSGDDASNQKTDTDDSPATSSRGGHGDGQREARPKTSHGGRMLESRRRNPRTISNRRASVDDAGSDAADRRQRMYQRVCVDEERTESTVARRSCPKSRGRSARRADCVAVHTNSLEQKYQELRDLLENQFLQEREELNRTLLKQTRQVMHKYQLAQSGYVAPRPTTAPASRRRHRAMRESDTQTTQTDESAQLRHTEDDIRLGEARCDGDTFILIDGTKENGVSVTKHVTFVSADEGSVHRTTAGGDVVDSEQQNVKRPGRLQRGREKTRDNVVTRRRRKQKTGGESTADSVQRSDDTSARDSDSSSGSTGYRGRRKLSDASNSTTASTSPSRGSSSIGPLCDHHLKYSSNAKLIEWLRRKNRVYRQQVAEERKVARKKRREEEEEQREKEMKREEAKHAMELWLKKKKSEERLLRRRQRTEAAFNLQQQLNTNIDNEVTLGTTMFLRSRDSQDGSSSARGKQYSSSVSNIHSKTVKQKHAIHGRNTSTNNNSRVDDTSDATVTPYVGNDHECMCGFNGDPNVSPFITGTQESTSERAKCADTEHTRPGSVNKQLPRHDHLSKQTTSSKARLGSSDKAPERRQSSDTKRRSVTSNNRLHKVRNQEKSGEVQPAGHDYTGVTGATPATDNAEVPATNGRGKPSVSRPAGTVGKGRRRRLRASQGEIIDKVHTENVININTAGVDDATEHPQSGKSGENGQEIPQSKELGRAPRRPTSSRPRSARRGRRLSFGTPSPPKHSASPTVGQSDPNVPISGRAPRKGRQHNERPASATSSLSASRSTCENRPITPKPELACSRPGYEKVQYQQKSWDSFSGHVWKQVNDDESDHAERPEPQGSDKPNDNPSPVSESRDVTSVDRDTTSSAPAAAGADTDGKDRDGSNEDKNGDEVRNDCGDSASQAKVESGQSRESITDRAGSSPTAGTGGETSEDVRTLSSDTDRTSSDDSVQEDVEVESDSSASTQPNIQETSDENDTGGVFVERDTAAIDAVTKTDAPSPVDVKGKRDENDNTDKDVTFLTNAEA